MYIKTMGLGMILAAVGTALAIWMAQCVAEAQETDPETAVAVARLQPRLTARRAREIAGWIDASASPRGLDPVLVAAMAMRESSYHPAVLDGRMLGARGEVGMMQIHPRSAAMRHAPSGCGQTDPRCSLETACGYLAWLRDEGCPGSTWRWMSAYGRRRCPTEAEARDGRAARRAWTLYQQAGGTRWEP